jgi:DNA-binding response OmpR family regulator
MARVLVIDDEVMLLETLQAALNGVNHEVAVADTAAKGLWLIDSFAPEIVVLDIHMPTTDGIETLGLIRKRKSNLPVVAISGGGRFQTADMLTFAKELGADAILQKPFSMAQFVALIDDVLTMKG